MVDEFGARSRIVASDGVEKSLDRITNLSPTAAAANESFLGIDRISPEVTFGRQRSLNGISNLRPDAVLISAKSGCSSEVGGAGSQTSSNVNASETAGGLAQCTSPDNT